ncbi:hypothetical protein OTU49_016097, partial [Cherax quadricarinatus]
QFQVLCISRVETFIRLIHGYCHFSSNVAKITFGQLLTIMKLWLTLQQFYFGSWFGHIAKYYHSASQYHPVSTFFLPESVVQKSTLYIPISAQSWWECEVFNW